MLRFEKAIANDANNLAKVSKRAFDNDIHYGARVEGGPPGYDSPEGQIFMMDHFMYYKMMLEDTIIGGFMIADKWDGHYELVRIFIEPNFQNMGFGIKTLEFIWRTYKRQVIYCRMCIKVGRLCSRRCYDGSLSPDLSRG